jgi:UDP-GlcNAc:undecaprenyl-phosphate/decaprenyl-phosphate GlcNAc-1-phosphate transferase
MAGYIVIFFVALTVSTLATPIARRVAIRLGVVDMPGARKIHASPIPLLGGAAVYLAFVLAVLLLGGDHPPGFLRQPVAIVVGGTLVAAVGFWDDSRGKRLGPLPKLVAEFLGAAILIWAGVQVEFLHQPELNVAVTVLWVVGITNAVNFLDNMDGLSTGVAAVAAAFFFLLAITNGQFLVASMSAALLGAALGFLRYNFILTGASGKATIFMGDMGALFLGFVLAALGIKLRFDNTDQVTWMIPVLVLGLPVFDTTLVTLSRLRRRVAPYVGGKDHFSHRLVTLGLTRHEAVLVLYLVAVAFGMCALFLLSASVAEGYFTAGVVLITCLLVLIRLEKVPV